MRFSNPEANVEKFKLEPGMLVADFGAGGGGHTLPSARAVGSRGMVYAIDIQQELLSRIKNNANKEGLSNVETVWGDVETSGGSGLQDNTVDAVIVSNVLFLVENKKGLVQEISRVLKQSGKALVIDWKDSFGGLGPQSEAIIPLQEAVDLFNEYGFYLHNQMQVGAHHYGAIFKRKD